jgi:hypothetical protein
MILFPALSKSIKRATVRPWCLPLGEVHLGEWVGMKPIRNSQFAIRNDALYETLKANADSLPLRSRSVS